MKVIFLSFHEFLSDLLHIYRVYSWGMGVLLGTQKFQFLPTNGIFSQKGEFCFFQKWQFLGVWCRKLSLNKIGVMDMSYIMDSGQNGLYTTFPNIFSLISAESADLSHNQKNHFFKKMLFFRSKICSRRDKTDSIGIAC